MRTLTPFPDASLRSDAIAEVTPDGAADVRDIEPAFGTLAEMDALIAEAHQRGMKILLDIVPNHCSDRHPRFQEALRAAAGRPGSRE
jgi:glycosidase